jgi:hypothetical protein
MRAQTPLGGVGFANHDAACGFQALRQQSVFVGDVVAQKRRAAGGGNACHIHQIFQGDGQAVKPAARMAL